MSLSPRVALVALVGALALLSTGAGPAGPGLGRQATPEEIAAWDISTPFDGANLPPGKGSVAEGAAVYAAKCQICHGSRGIGNPADRLTGGVGSLTGRPVKTVNSFWPYATTAFDYIRRAMPLNAPQTLTDNEVYAVVAYLLSIDSIIAPDAVLDANSLSLVKMPNRGGFVNWYNKPAIPASPAR
ncbi:MAG: cytochrome c [Bauldia sp.]